MTVLGEAEPSKICVKDKSEVLSHTHEIVQAHEHTYTGTGCTPLDLPQGTIREKPTIRNALLAFLGSFKAWAEI